ncbi:hypothetical protein PAERUG_P54_1_London_24_VIM_2_04_13_03639 [Pseudomonas aeruginosa]|nr:hypothetical protein PAERUG_P54_1_London_24_VIM_2_04_13_03639 [Pseudomonas aeruginosa]
MGRKERARGARAPPGVSTLVESERGETEGGDAGVLQASGAAEFRQVDDRRGLEDPGPEASYQARGRQQGPAGGDEVVEDQYAVAFAEAVGMYFEEGLAVFGLVALGEYVGG